MLSFPNAKINLGLNIVSRRPDGYHDLESCFYPIPWCDALEVLPAEKLTFTSTGLDIPGTPESNLCLRAYDLLQKTYDLPGAHIHLHKVIPMGAGLGGGSADGAFTLKMLNELFDLGLDVPTLQNLAGQLGSDCPFFIENKPVLATGTGTVFREVALDLSGKHIAIKHPHIHVSTQKAYSLIKPSAPDYSIENTLKEPISQWRNALKNDFEASVFGQFPEIQQIKEELYASGALYAAMSGSGSAVFGLFEQEISLEGYVTFSL
ncbi:MAG: 4-(cytidine 5'-diphospho)-2-C-methyl-D-erythritol kinase [Marinoscillum sp.]|uniref:4-(cytidine 5'-diphospho)-2-C-methyl-D-erythritol kinase n=1 Tax=Marinoscillum sp. TaxID=2024838 RepID=UPI0032F12165